MQRVDETYLLRAERGGRCWPESVGAYPVVLLTRRAFARSTDEILGRRATAPCSVNPLVEPKRPPS